jgi:two-component system sensor histidine kinase CiaH
MKKTWKRFAAWAIDLQSNLFTWARIKLTALYLLIIIATLTVYSTAMYFSLLGNIQNEASDTTNPFLRHQIFDTGIDHIQLQIFIIDAITFIIAAIGSYWLAGATLKPIKKTLEAQEAFSADASHELRTPLAVMKTDIEVLLRSKEVFSPNVTNVLKSNLEEITILTTMTSDLLELSRGNNKAGEDVSINVLLQEESTKLQTLAQQKDVSLVCENSTDVLLAEGNKEGLRRVFKNIIANAITYTPAQGIVTIIVENLKEKILITISDNGIGIDQKDLPHIFDRFYKADNARTHAKNGSGLGLAIAKRIIEQYKGSITIESTLGKGTDVKIIVPHS